MDLNLINLSSEWNKVKRSTNSLESGTDGVWITKLICIMILFIEPKYMGQVYRPSLRRPLGACPMMGLRRRHLSDCVNNKMIFSRLN
jgi:hypothetical protein